MKKSEPLFPLPIYSELFDQNRFRALCEPDCQQQLIFPTNELPPFQFLRDSSLQLPTQLYIRNICDDGNYYKMLPEYITSNEERYKNTLGDYPKASGIFDNGVDPPFGGTPEIATINCSKLQAVELSPYWTIATDAKIEFNTASGGVPFHFKMIVDRFLNAGSFSIKVYDGDETDTLLGTIISSGVYNYNFNATNGKITILFENFASGDYFEISHFNARYINPLDYQLTVNDRQLGANDVVIKNLTDGRDMIFYCHGGTDYHLPVGNYYYILNCDGELYFSEVFTLKTPKELEKYFRLRWLNSCDIGDSIIWKTATLGALCFYNSIYLDSALFNPEYETELDQQENGQGDKNPTFKRWQKAINLDIPKSPPFLTDALSGLFLHDGVYLREPLAEKQEAPNAEYQILSVTSEIRDVLLNCYQSVKLRLLLNTKYVGKICCDDVAIFDCDLIETPTITDVNEILTNVFSIEGAATPGAFAVVEYNLNGGGWVASGEYAAVNDDGTYAVTFDASGLGAISDLDIRILCKTVECAGQTSAPQDIG